MSASPDTTELSLPKQGLSQIPEYVRGLTALKKIDCPLNTDLSELPEWISELKQLEIGSDSYFALPLPCHAWS